jgi:predicted transposase/invertase (TIGR01784 family)
VDDSNYNLEAAAHTNDGFFKSIFSQPEHAIALFQGHLPIDVSSKIDWSSLSVLPGSFVKSSLQQVHADLLFSVRMDEREALLYLLFEHQSTPDPTMPLRLLGYMTEIFSNHQKQHGLPLPAVIPFVFHQGPDSWNVSPHFEKLLQLPEDSFQPLSPYVPKFQHVLLDLSRYDPSSEEKDQRLQVVLQLMKLARQKDLLTFFLWLAEFPAKLFPDSLLSLMLLYALHSDSELDAKAIYHTLSSNPELEKKTMSIAEKLRAEGMMEGISQGIEKGIEKGITQGRWVGRIQTLQEFLDVPITSQEILEALETEDLMAIHAALHGDYEMRFKR